MSNIVFSFDAQAYGVLTAIDSIVQAFGALINTAENVASSFGSVASQSATLMTGLSGLIQNFGALSGTMNDSNAAMGSAGSSASNLAYQLQQLGQRAADAAQAHKQAVQNIQQQEADLTQTTQEQIASREQSYDQSLQNMVQQHAYSVQQIADQENKLTQTYEETIDKRLQALNDPRAMQHKYIVDALQQQIDAALATGNTGAIAGLQAQLDAQNAAYNTYITKTIEPYYKDLDQKGFQSHQDALTQLQNRLTQENTMYAQHLSDLKTNYDKQLALTELHYQQEESKLAQHLADENIKYAEQVAQINNERAHIISSGGGGGSGAAPYGSPSTDSFIALFKKLGINTSTPQGAVQAENALQAFLTGGSYMGQNFGQGYAPKSQMNIQQLWGVITQAMAYGQDPTKNLGGGNLLDVISNLMVNAQLINGKDPTAAYNSILSIFEKAESGNTIGLERQLAALGISPQLLEKYGVKFGGRGGKTIQNPGDVLNALEQIGLAPGFAGQGQAQSRDTPTGAMTRLKDLWTGIVTNIIGNVQDPTSIMHKFMDVVNKLLAFLGSKRNDIINFGKTIAEWLTGKFSDFVNWLSSSQAKSVLSDIGKGFKEIGDALHWMGQHKDILLILAGVLGAQTGSKMLMGFGGTLLKGGKGFASGGLFGGIIPGTRQGLLQGAGGGVVDGVLGLLNMFGMHGIKPLGNLTGDAKQLFGEDPSNAFDAMFGGSASSRSGGVKSAIDAVTMAVKALGDIYITAKNVYVTGPMRNSRGGPNGNPTDPFGTPNENPLAQEGGALAPYGENGLQTVEGEVRDLTGAGGGGLIGWWKRFNRRLSGNQGVVPFTGEGGVGGGVTITEEAMGGPAGVPQGLLGKIMGFLGIGGKAATGAIEGGASTGAIGGGEGIAGLLGAGAAGGETAAGGGILASIGPALGAIAASAGPIALAAGAIIGLVAVLVANRDKIMPFIHTVADFFGKQLGNFIKEMQKFAGQVGSRFNAAFGPGSAVHGILMWLSSFWSGAWGGIQMAFKGVWDIILGVLKIAWAIVSGIILVGMDLLGGKWGLAWTDLKNMVGKVFDGIGTLLHGAILLILGVIGGLAVGIWDVLWGGLQKVGSMFVGFWQGLWGLITFPLSMMGVNIGKWLEGVGKGMLNFFTQTIPNAIGQAFSGMGTLLKKGVDWLIDHVLPGPLQGPVHSALGFADGGMYPGGEVSVVGERGPELFFSQHRGPIVSNAQIRQALLGGGNARHSAGGGNVTINGPIHVYGVQNPADFYRKMNKMAGKYAEHGVRGALN